MTASKRTVESVFRHVTGKNDPCVLSQAWTPAVFTFGEVGQPPRKDAVTGEQLSVTRGVPRGDGLTAQHGPQAGMLLNHPRGP